MQWFFIVLICVISIVVLLLVPIVFSFRIYFNVLKNTGTIKIKIFGIPITTFQVAIHELAIYIIKPKGKQRKIPISLVDETAIFINHFVTTFFRYIRIVECDIFANVGKSNDAYHTAMFGAWMQNILYSFFAMLITIKRVHKTQCDIDYTHENSELKLSSYIRLSSCFLFIIISLIRAKFRTNRTVNVYENFFSRQ